jgi:hypothetical protein
VVACAASPARRAWWFSSKSSSNTCLAAGLGFRLKKKSLSQAGIFVSLYSACGGIFLYTRPAKVNPQAHFVRFPHLSEKVYNGVILSYF